MDYTKIRLTAESDQLDQITSALAELGIFGTIVDDPVEIALALEKKYDYEWDEVDPALYQAADLPAAITLYVPDTMEGLNRLDQVINLAVGFGLSEVEIGSVSDSFWNDQWKLWFQPVQIGQRLWIRPSWEDLPEAATAVGRPDSAVAWPWSDAAGLDTRAPNKGELAEVVIDPGTAFGTGNHSTTRFCLEYLEKLSGPDITAVTDIGTGSGILAIAAAKLGARAVNAFDADPAVIAVAQANIKLNQVADIIKVQQLDLLSIPADAISLPPADLMVANLYAGLVTEYAKVIRPFLRGPKLFVASGILTEQLATVVGELTESGYRIQDIRKENEWAALAAQYAGELEIER